MLYFLFLTPSVSRFVQGWDMTTYECVKTLEGHTNAVSSIVKTEEYLISGSWDKTVKVAQLTRNFPSSHPETNLSFSTNTIART